MATTTENVGETDVQIQETAEEFKPSERESDDRGDNKRLNEDANDGGHKKKPRSEKQIAAAKKLVELQKERMARGEPAGRRKGAVGKKNLDKIQYSGENNTQDYFTKRYDTELLYEFDRLRRDEDKKKRLGEALNHHFSAFKDELRSEIRDEMNSNIQKAFEGPLNNFFRIDDETEESPEPEEEPEKTSEKESKKENKVEDKAPKNETKFGSFFPVHRSQSSSTGESSKSERSNRRSFWN